ncbi:MAG: glutaredoxin family protein [Streptococcus orisratti]|nr:thioredoxin [Streptococcus orisratti]MCI7677652.1 glutaredoxin family protein [Streptococcus orisratti]
MTDRFAFPKRFLGVLAAITVIFFTVVGIQTTWNTYVVKDYNKQLTGQVYVDAAVNQNVNLVFYRNGCPYCKAGKEAVINSAEKSSYPTFYIDVESEDGQILIEKYHVDKAATLVTIRDGKFKLFLYATKDKAGKIRADKKAIKEALNDYNS